MKDYEIQSKRLLHCPLYFDPDCTYYLYSNEYWVFSEYPLEIQMFLWSPGQWHSEGK